MLNWRRNRFDPRFEAPIYKNRVGSLHMITWSHQQTASPLLGNCVDEVFPPPYAELRTATQHCARPRCEVALVTYAIFDLSRRNAPLTHILLKSWRLGNHPNPEGCHEHRPHRRLSCGLRRVSPQGHTNPFVAKGYRGHGPVRMAHAAGRAGSHLASDERGPYLLMVGSAGHRRSGRRP
jgi:hypothetical protein